MTHFAGHSSLAVQVSQPLHPPSADRLSSPPQAAGFPAGGFHEFYSSVGLIETRFTQRRSWLAGVDGFPLHGSFRQLSLYASPPLASFGVRHTQLRLQCAQRGTTLNHPTTPKKDRQRRNKVCSFHSQSLCRRSQTPVFKWPNYVLKHVTR